jgi:hypothetical protein
LYNCVCGHELASHKTEAEGYITLSEKVAHWCAECALTNAMNRKNFHTFKLDNLSLIEKLARERHLI